MRAQLLSSILLLGFWGISNVTFAVFRHKHAAHPPATHAGQYPPHGMGQEHFYPYQYPQGQLGTGGGTGMMGQGSGGPGFPSSPKKLGY